MSTHHGELTAAGGWLQERGASDDWRLALTLVRRDDGQYLEARLPNEATAFEGRVVFDGELRCDIWCRFSGLGFRITGEKRGPRYALTAEVVVAPGRSIPLVDAVAA